MRARVKQALHPDDFLPPPVVQAPVAAPAAGLIDVRALFAVLQRRWKIILFGMLAGLVLAVAGVLAMPVRFTATAVVFVDPRTPRVTPSEQVLPSIGQDSAALESLVQLIRSDGFLLKVVTKLDLAKDPEFTSTGLFGGSPPKDAVALADRFRERLAVNRRGATYIVEVAFTSKDAEKSARYANAVAEAFVADQVNQRSDAAGRATDFLSERLDAQRRKVSESEAAVSAFKAKYNIVKASATDTLNEKELSELNLQLVAARSKTAELKAKVDEISRAKSRPAGALPEALGSTALTNLRSQYAQLARQEADSQMVYGDKHPRLVSLRAEIANLQRQITAELDRVLASVQNEYQVAKSREASLADSLDKLKSSTIETDQASVKLRELELEAQANRNLYEQYLARYKETNEQRDLRTSETRLFSVAAPPLKPNRPSLALVAAIGLLGGAMLGLGGAMVTDALDGRMRSPEQIEERFGFPCVSVLPFVPAPPKTRLPSLRSIRSARGEGGAPRARSIQSDEEAGFELQAGFARGLRRLKVALRTGRRRAPRRVFLVTSAQPGEGKSTVAAGLARQFAQDGLRTLLIDADCLDERVANHAGLFEVLRGETALSDALVVDQASGLMMLELGRPSGKAGPLDLFVDPELPRFVKEALERFDVVVFDGPPAAEIIPMEGMMDLADSALLVMDWNSPDTKRVQAALATLAPDGDAEIGIVLNKVDLKSYRFYDPAYAKGG